MIAAQRRVADQCRHVQRGIGRFHRRAVIAEAWVNEGTQAVFVYPRFSDYRAAVEAANTTLNVAALIGHTALRSNHLDDLFRTATPEEIAAMREQLRESLEAGALGLSTGLAYAS